MRRSRKNFLSFLILTSCLFSCKTPKLSESSLAEGGGVPLDRLPGIITKEMLYLGVFKICPEYSNVQCATGFLISDDGYFLTAEHIANSYRSRMNENLDPRTVIPTNVKKFAVSGIRASDGDFIETARFELVTIVKTRPSKVYPADDLALMKLKDVSKSNLEKLKKWSIPLKLANTLPDPFERIYAAGYSYPKYSPEEVKLSIENYKKMYREHLNKSPVVPEIVLPNFNLFVSTGLFGGSDSSGKTFSSKYPIDPKTELPMRVTPFDNATVDHLLELKKDHTINTWGRISIDLISGMSGGPIFRKNAEVVGVAVSSSDRSKMGSDNIDEPASTTEGQGIPYYAKYFNLKDFTLQKESSDVLSKKAKEKFDRIKKTLDSNTLNQLTDIKSVIAILRKRGTLQKVFKQKEGDYPSGNAYGTPSTHWDASTTCVTAGPSDDYEVKNIEVKIQIVDESISYVWWNSEERGAWKLLWKIPMRKWSPRYTVPTRVLLTNAVHVNPFELEIENVEMKGFAPYFLGESSLDLGFFDDHKQSLLSIMGVSILGGRLPDSPSENDKSEWYWKIHNCYSI